MQSANNAIPKLTSGLKGDYQQASQSREMAIPEGHNRVFKSLDALHETIAQLEQRLQPALRVEPTQPTGIGVKESLRENVTIYEKLESHNDSINCANNRITELLRLLEM